MMLQPAMLCYYSKKIEGEYVTKIGTSAFYGNGLKALNLTNATNLTTISKYSFFNNIVLNAINTNMTSEAFNSASKGTNLIMSTQSVIITYLT